MCSNVIVLSALALILPFITCTETEVVTTASGPVVGKILESPDGHPVSAFYGIPYAVPPIGDLRFTQSIKADSWTTTLNATQPKPACYQERMEGISPEMTFPMSEDCLTLSVFAPHPKPTNAPVVVYIHGGAFRIGSSSMGVDHTILSSHGVITVAINYRLGIFGFFGLGREDAPGNVGMLDQHLAIQWVQENIEAFGGNKSSVTLFGCSAGSASVGYHLLSPISAGSFNRAIMMSGAPTNSWAIVDRKDLKHLTDDLFSKTRCNQSTETGSLQCLRGKAPEELVNNVMRMSEIFSPSFVPSVDGKFLLVDPSLSVRAGHLNKGEVLIGTSIDDATGFMLGSNSDVIRAQDGHLNRTDLLKVIKRTLSSITDLQAKVLDAVYSDWTDPEDPIKLRDSASAIYNDGQFVCGVNEFSDGLVRSGNQVYRWLFEYKTTSAAKNFPAWMKATHCWDQIMLIGTSDFRLPETAEDAQVRERFLRNVLNFIRTGNPNGIAEEEHWSKFNVGRQFNHIAGTSSVGNNYRVQKCAVWSKILPLL